MKLPLITSADECLWQATILGEPASKANSRRMKYKTSKSGATYQRPIKSEKAINYVTYAMAQLAMYRPKEPIGEDIAILCHIWYVDRRSDLVESLILDVLQQARIIENDRAIRTKYIFGHVDKHRPRATIALYRWEGERR